MSVTGNINPLISTQSPLLHVGLYLKTQALYFQVQTWNRFSIRIITTKTSVQLTLISQNLPELLWKSQSNIIWMSTDIDNIGPHSKTWVFFGPMSRPTYGLISPNFLGPRYNGSIMDNQTHTYLYKSLG